MRGSSIRVNWNRVLIDVCCQHDYLDEGAICQIANRQSVVENLRRLFEWLRDSQLAVISSMESHRSSEPINGVPLHCVDGTSGQDKLDFTLLTPRLLVETDNYLSLPPNLREEYRQLIFRKRNREVLSNPKADRFLTQLSASEFIIAGVGLERSIKPLALGLIARQKSVSVVIDACGFWSSLDADLSARLLEAKNVRLITTAELLASSPCPPAVRKSSRSSRTLIRHHPAPAAKNRRTVSRAVKSH